VCVNLIVRRCHQIPLPVPGTVATGKIKKQLQEKERETTKKLKKKTGKNLCMKIMKPEENVATGNKMDYNNNNNNNNILLGFGPHAGRNAKFLQGPSFK
jgi:late competence protein required for DNA uptake (superfamily II DNA/RNA helicase)